MASADKPPEEEGGTGASTQVALQGCSATLGSASLRSDADTTQATCTLQEYSAALSSASPGGDADTGQATCTLREYSAALSSATYTLEETSVSVSVGNHGTSVDIHLSGSPTQNTQSSAAPRPQTLGATASRVSSHESQRSKSKSDLDRDAMDKALTMCKSPLVLQEDVLRGAPLSFTMRRFGSLWRTSPLDRMPAAAGELWAKSRPCDSLDTFLSHAWQSPGWQKYMSLLLMFYSTPAKCSFVLTFILLFALDLASFLPTVELEFVEGDGNMTVLEFCPWATIPVWVSLLTLFAGPSGRCVRDRNTFFDAVCINQVDDDLKRAGVYSLSGILAKSHELTILWSPPYLSRLWCVYELATYAAIKPDGRINFCPLFKYLILLAGFIGVTAFTGNATLFVMCGLTPLSFQVGFIVSIVFFTIMVRQWLPLIRAQKQLMEQLQAFKIENAECREERDRGFIVQSIQQLHGSEAAFNAYVQGPLKDRVRQSLPVAGLTYLEVLGMSIPMACHWCQWIAAYARKGMPWLELGDYILKAIASFACFTPGPIKLLQFLISRSAARRPTPCVDTAISIRINLAMYVIVLLIVWAQWAGPHLVQMFGLWFLIGGVAMTGLIFYLDALQASKQSSDSPASGGVG